MLDDYVDGLRSVAEARMTDEFDVYSPDPGAETTNAEGFIVPGYATENPVMGRIAGPSMQSRDTNTRTVTIGGTERQVVEGGLHIPISADAPAAGEYGAGWEYELVATGPTT